MLSIDEAIAHEKEKAKLHRESIIPKDRYYNMPHVDSANKSHTFYAEEHEQLAEWLEELKVYHKHEVICNKGYNAGYNKAIDDFVKFASDMPTVEEEDGTIRPMWLEEMAEKLKAGGENEC